MKALLGVDKIERMHEDGPNRNYVTVRQKNKKITIKIFAIKALHVLLYKDFID